MAITKIYKGSQELENVVRIYKGSELLWEKQTTPPIPAYLTFQSDSSFTLKVYDNTKHWNGTLYYSTDLETWHEWNGTTISSNVNNKLYLRGKGNTVITGNNQDYRWVLEGSNIECVGNIENLLDWEAVASGDHPSMASYCYAHLFRDCAALVSAPVLPATTLANYCYQRMFSGCTSLASALALPATTLANYCYEYMFYGCTALVSAPVLPATTLASSCYSGMFSGCTNLTSAPALPATTLASNCYRNMFRNCTSLTSAPALPATTLADHCYAYMLWGCTALASAPVLPATTLANYCYQYMFYGCTALTSAPVLPATTLAEYCYRGMFQGCTSLKISSTQTETYQYEWRIPTSGTGTTAFNWNTDMFSGTGGTFTGNPSINTAYYVENPPVV
jgi:hypothetical protein